MTFSSDEKGYITSTRYDSASHPGLDRLPLLHRLADAEVHHDLFAAPRYGVGADVPVQPLHLLPLPAPDVGRAPEDLRSLSRAVLEHLRGLHLGQRGDAGQGFGALVLWQRAHLVRYVLHLVVRGVDLSDHVRELGTNHGMLHELLAEGPPPVRVLERLLVANPGEPVRLHHESPALVVKVVHDVLEPLVLGADEVTHRNLDVLKGDEAGAARPYAHAVHASANHTGHGLLDE